MARVQRVVIGIDFTDPAINSERWVARYVTPGAELMLVHVLEIPPSPAFLRRFAPPAELIETARAGAEQRLRELSISFGERRSWIEVRVGDPAAEIAAVARESGADLIVVGRHGVGVGRWGRLGTTAERLVRDAPTPVLLAFGAPSALPRRVLVALDDGPDTERILEWAARACANGGEQLTALHVVGNAVLSHMLPAAGRTNGRRMEDDGLRHELEEEARRWLDQGLRVRTSGVIRSSMVTSGDPATEILAASERVGADLIVIGSRGAGQVRQALLGSVARDVLRGATRPVLVVTPPGDAIADELEGAHMDSALAAPAR